MKICFPLQIEIAANISAKWGLHYFKFDWCCSPVHSWKKYSPVRWLHARLNWFLAWRLFNNNILLKRAAGSHTTGFNFMQRVWIFIFPNCYRESNFNLFAVSVNTKAHLVYPLKVLKNINRESSQNCYRVFKCLWLPWQAFSFNSH